MLAIEDLKRIEKLFSRCRILQLKSDAILKDIGLGSAWPAVGKVPGMRHKKAYEDPYLDRKTRKNNLDRTVYAFEPTAKRKAHPDAQIVNAIEERFELEREIDRVNAELQKIENKIFSFCAPYPAEVLIRRFIFRQQWKHLSEQMHISIDAARGHYYAGLEQYGSTLKNK